FLSVLANLVLPVTTASGDSSMRLYVDPNSPAHYETVVNPADHTAAVLAGIPQARWFTNDTPTSSVRNAVATYVNGAAAANSIPILVVYAIPFRDCGSYSAGGFPDAASYSAWIQQVRSGI